MDTVGSLLEWLQLHWGRGQRGGSGLVSCLIDLVANIVDVFYPIMATASKQIYGQYI